MVETDQAHVLVLWILPQPRGIFILDLPEPTWFSDLVALNYNLCKRGHLL